MLSLTPEEWTAVALSLRIALVATVVSLPFGIAVAWLLARKDFWGKALLDGVVHLPLVLPPVVTGYLLLITFGRKGAVGAFLDDYLGIVFSFRWTGAALACGVMAFPLLVRAIRLSFEAIDRRLEDAASTLGASGFWAFLTVTLPLALPGVIAGMVLELRQGARRIRRHHHLRLQHPRRDADPLGRDLHLHADPRRRRRGDAARHRRHRASRSPRSSRRSGSPAAPACATTGTEMLSVDVEKRLGEFQIAAKFETGGRRDRAVRPLRRRQDLDRQHDRRAGRAGPRAHRARRSCAVRQRRAHQRPGAPPPHRLCVPGGPAVSAPDGRAEPRLRPLDERHAASIRPSASASSRCSTSARCSRAGPGICRAASASASRSAARCLMKPRLLLLDEPLASLDRARKLEILPYLARLRDEAKVPMIYVSHQAGEISALCSQVVRIEDGRVAAVRRAGAAGCGSRALDEFATAVGACSRPSESSA